ncbi:MAG: tRNA (adenosine(37)-N6)-threonylcarbamoyltransferase complex transferase subunit TsaD [Candidatus Vogelbacteria bacterium]|nr:tRNA (adenosine(37)-N6)-threonylcarbamoyltransferase complex transferase subunit TsaD [Candidatus Vogelbacteria bacterium]
MTVLGIETSCDETAISVVAGRGGLRQPSFRPLSQIVASQIKVHAPHGGVVPSLAKREHGKNLVPVLLKALKNAKLKTKKEKPQFETENKIRKILEREPELSEQFLRTFLKGVSRKVLWVPKIDAIAVTHGPGLEPALWVGINLARVLALVWQKPLIPINHMEGHIYSVLVNVKATPWRTKGVALTFPALALLISGGHTELILIKDWLQYKRLGQTRDDAAGEAFDKVARLLDLPYPGGPALSKLAAQTRTLGVKDPQHPVLPWNPLPRPMINSENFDFSFSGLKTAVLYRLQKIPRTVLSGSQGQSLKIQIAGDFQQAVIDVLLAKTARAIEKYAPKTLIIAGGVSANKALRRQFTKHLTKHYPAVKLLLPTPKLSLDNATMIAVAGYLRLFQGSPLRPLFKGDPFPLIRAQGRLVLK